MMCCKHSIDFSRVLAYYEKAPDKFIMGYAPDPRKPDAIYKMQSAIDTYGVKLCAEIKFRMMYDNPDAIDLFRYCGERGVPVTLHLDYANAHIAAPGMPWKKYWYGGDMFALERVLQLCPDTNFLGHACCFWGNISADDQWRTADYPQGPVVPGGHLEQLLDKYDNLYCDCSGDSGCLALKRDPEYTTQLIMKHPDRFIFARDCFTNHLSAYFDTLSLPEEVRENFYHSNLERLICATK